MENMWSYILFMGLLSGPCHKYLCFLYIHLIAPAKISYTAAVCDSYKIYADSLSSLTVHLTFAAKL